MITIKARPASASAVSRAAARTGAPFGTIAKMAGLWLDGKDTYTIAERLGLTEDKVALLLHAWMDERRAGR